MTRKAIETARRAELWRAQQARQARDAREAAETLLEDRGPVNARAWAEHCMVRSSDGFWRLVLEEFARLEREAGR
jgi:hypothetical protein